MFLKTAVKPPQLIYLEEVHGRTHMTEMDRRKYFNLKLGYDGEKKVFDYLNQFKQGVCIWDIRLDISGEIQYDFIVITNGHIIILEIKNWFGNYTYHEGNLKSPSGYVNRDVFSQASNERDKLEVFCYENNIHYKIVNEVVFVNETFQIINEVTDYEIHGMEYIEKVARYMNQFEITKEDLAIGECIIKHHLEKSKNEVNHLYPYHLMRRGLKCPECRRFLKIERSAKKKINCNCGHVMDKAEAIREAFRNIEMLKRDCVTASDVGEWIDISSTRIRKVLNDYCIKIGSNKGRKYKSRESWLR
ncbi:nuclease-related domain-containing protein [Macrococcus equi]|uniref:nuclease-related domain-containing protein n=1 Tax=Macrococcus equi TaxID=3395462 RepID=UPI0039BDC03F